MVLLKNQQEIKFDYQYKKLLVHPTKPLLFFLYSVFMLNICCVHRNMEKN